MLSNQDFIELEQKRPIVDDENRADRGQNLTMLSLSTLRLLRHFSSIS